MKTLKMRSRTLFRAKQLVQYPQLIILLGLSSSSHPALSPRDKTLATARYSGSRDASGQHPDDIWPQTGNYLDQQPYMNIEQER